MKMILSSLKCVWSFGGYKMRRITKTIPPEEFLEYLKTPGVSYEGLSGQPKQALRQRLLEDQGYICCYCGKQIHNDEHTKIEHIKCQKNYGHLELCFSNMLASCDGGEFDRANRVRPRHQVHCDAKKGNDDIPVSPLDDVSELFSFFDDGTIKGKGDIGKELVRKLGLDVAFLNTQRKNAIENYEILAPDDLQKELQFLGEMHDGCFEEFCFVLEQYILDLINSEDFMPTSVSEVFSTV